jgi:ABC-2 type transport system permease protein
MSATVTHSWSMTMRHLRNLGRQPWWIAITLVQPVIWLLLFGAVFKATADIPGFAADSYASWSPRSGARRSSPAGWSSWASSR